MMSTLKRIARICIVGIAALALVVAALFVLRSGARPLYHRAVNAACLQWMLETSHTNVYPNANGMGSNSLAMLERYFGHDIQRYGYVPGLSYDDPKDLVLMYVRTRYTWHGDATHTVFSPKRWLILSPEIDDGTCPEGGELVDTPVFKRRLQMTVAFLRDHGRPYWQVVAQEQSNFLKSVKD